MFTTLIPRHISRRLCAPSRSLRSKQHISSFYFALGDVTDLISSIYSQGKIRHIGLSAVSSTTFRRAITVGPVAAVQADYSVFQQEKEGHSGSDILATCRELGVAIVAATPLGRGIITATFAQGQSLRGGKDMRPYLCRGSKKCIALLTRT
jgi:aryl-alcohol dehydrogenase-like predicted oxidoreductase